MNIAVTASGPTLDSAVYEEFCHTPYLNIINMETMGCTSMVHTIFPGSDCELARAVLAHHCEAVITGKLTEAAFNIIADAGVTRFLAKNMSTQDALEAMEKRELSLIRNPNGSEACSGDHRF